MSQDTHPGHQLRMTQELRLELRMTQELRLAIKLLQLPRLELLETVNQELSANPLLEESDNETEDGALPEAEAPGTEKAHEQTVAGATAEEPSQERRESETEIDWQTYFENADLFRDERLYPRPDAEDIPSYDSFLTRKITLSDHLLWQLRLSGLRQEQITIGAYIIENLNEDGYLISEESGEDLIALIARKADATSASVEAVLRRIQEFDPLGVGCRSVDECLTVQARVLGIRNGLVYDIISRHMGDLTQRNYKRIAAGLQQPIDAVLAAVQIISHLEPKPGRSYSSEEPQYISPDVYIFKVGDHYVVHLNDDGLPKLRISNLYRNALRRGSEANQKTKSFIRERLRSARWLVLSIWQRQSTIKKVADSIVRHQEAFLDKGIHYLRPLVLRDVASDIGMHESTVSRATSNKYASTPQGLLELKFFFSNGLSRRGAQDIASGSVKQRVKEIIGTENSHKPLSDQAIARTLFSENINIARRTVAKYREGLKILPSSKRKSLG